MSISNNVFRFLQTSSNFVPVDGSVVLDIVVPNTAVIADYIDKTLVLTATASSNTSVSQQQEQADLANYVLKTGSIVTGPISLAGNGSIIFADSSQQYQAFSNSKDATLATIALNTQYINTNGTDTQIQSLSVLNNINVNPNALPIESDNLLQGSLDIINANIQTANTNISSNASNIATLQGQIIDHSAHLLSLDGITDSLTANVSTNLNSININSFQIDIINGK